MNFFHLILFTTISITYGFESKHILNYIKQVQQEFDKLIISNKNNITENILPDLNLLLLLSN